MRPRRHRLRRCARSCSNRRRTVRSVLFVDDLHLLDNTSATLLGQLVDADLLFLVATVRTRRVGVPGARGAVAPSPCAADRPRRPRSCRGRHLAPPRAARAGRDEHDHRDLVGEPGQRAVRARTGARRTRRRSARRTARRLAPDGQPGSRLSACTNSSPGDSARLDAASETLDVLAVWEPIGIAALEEMTGSEQLETARSSGTAHDPGRWPSSTGVARAPSVWRDASGPDAGADPATAVDRAGRSARDDRGSTARGRDADRGGPAAGRRLGRSRASPARRLAWRATRSTSRRSSGSRAPPRLHSMTAELGLLLGEALHEAGSYTEADEVLLAAEQAAAESIPCSFTSPSCAHAT